MLCIIQRQGEELKERLVSEAGVLRKHLPGRDEPDHYEVLVQCITLLRVSRAVWNARARVFYA